MTSKKQIIEWLKKQEEDIQTSALTERELATLFCKLFPDSKFSWHTIRRWIQLMRNGKLIENNKVDLDEIANQMLSNIDGAKIFETTPDFSDPLSNLIDFPISWSEVNEPVVIQGIKRLGVCNDLHIPYHCQYGVRACFSEFKKREVDGIYLNGDILDLEEVSRFEKMPTKMYLKDEIDVGRKFLDSLRKLFPNIPIYWKDGNHEKRLQSYIATRCDELANLYGLDIPTQLQFDKYDIQYVPEHKVAKFGKLWIAHGHELGLKSGTVNIARQVRMRVGVNVMFGHWHKNQNDSSRNLADEVHSAWSIGCLCYLKPRYTGVLNQWTQGGATIDLHEEGNFTVSAFQIQDGVVI